MSRCTYIRLVATQIWPLLRKAAQNNSSATFSTSTSGITIAASLPPSSSVTRFSVGAADSMTRRPVAVEPVKLILSKPVWPVIQGPSASPPLTILSTPGGSRSFTSSPNVRVERGVNGEGLRTKLLRESRAGPAWKRDSSSGEFQEQNGEVGG